MLYSNPQHITSKAYAISHTIFQLVGNHDVFERPPTTRDPIHGYPTWAVSHMKLGTIYLRTKFTTKSKMITSPHISLLHVIFYIQNFCEF